MDLVDRFRQLVRTEFCYISWIALQNKMLLHVAWLVHYFRLHVNKSS